jgi:hypothetical protein
MHLAWKLTAGASVALIAAACSQAQTEVGVKTDRSMAAAETAAPPSGTTLPINARPGECYARVTYPARTEMRSETVTLRPATERVVAVPAVYGWETKRIVLREESQRLVVRPATYRWVEERVMVHPERYRTVYTPAVYENRVERVLVTPARQVWKRGRPVPGQKTRIDPASGDILCLVEEPAVYRNVVQRVLVRPAETRQVVAAPAVYRTVRRQVVDQPARTETVVIPAVTREVRVRSIVQPASERRETIPAVTRTVSRQVVVAPARFEWRQVLCEVNETPPVVTALQNALRAAGHNPGPTTGRLNAQTFAAARSYEAASGLPMSPSGAVSVETLRRLGVRWN